MRRALAVVASVLVLGLQSGAALADSATSPTGQVNCTTPPSTGTIAIDNGPLNGPKAYPGTPTVVETTIRLDSQQAQPDLAIGAKLLPTEHVTTEPTTPGLSVRIDDGAWQHLGLSWNWRSWPNDMPYWDGPATRTGLTPGTHRLQFLVTLPADAPSGGYEIQPHFGSDLCSGLKWGGPPGGAVLYFFGVTHGSSGGQPAPTAGGVATATRKATAMPAPSPSEQPTDTPSPTVSVGDIPSATPTWSGSAPGTEAPSPSASVTNDPATPVARASSSSLGWAAGVVAIVLAAGAGGLFWHRRQRVKTAAAPGTAD